MSLQSADNKSGPFVASTDTFPCTFKIFAEDEIFVTLTDPSGNESTLVLNSDYTVTGITEVGFNVVTTITYGATYQITVTRDVEETQLATFKTQGPREAKRNENAHDKAMMAIQEIAEGNSRAIKVPVSSTLDPDSIFQDLLDGTLTAVAYTSEKLLSNYTSLAEAITSIASNEVNLVIDTDDTLTGNVTVPSNIALRFIKGNVITTGANTLTINGPIIAGVYQIFNSTSGTVTGDIDVTDIIPQWWGALGDGVTDDTLALQAAELCGRTNGISLYIPPGTYNVSGVVGSDAGSPMKIWGAGKLSVLHSGTYSGIVLKVATGSEVHSIRFVGDNRSYGATGINSSTGYVCRFHDLTFSQVGTCIELPNCWGATIESIHGVNVGTGLKLSKFNGGLASEIYFNNHTGEAVAIDSSNGVLFNGLIMENGQTAGIHRFKSQGNQCLTIDGCYTEGALGVGGADFSFQTKSGIGASTNIVVRNAWLNTNANTGEALFLLPAARNVLLENITVYTPTAAYHPHFIDTGGTNWNIRVGPWFRDAGDATIPLADDNQKITVIAPVDDSLVFDVVDTSGNLPYHSHSPLDIPFGSTVSDWQAVSGGVLAYSANSVYVYSEYARNVQMDYRLTVTASSGLQPFYSLSIQNVTNSFIKTTSESSPSSGAIVEKQLYVKLDAGWNEIKMGVSRDQGGGGTNTLDILSAFPSK